MSDTDGVMVTLSVHLKPEMADAVVEGFPVAIKDTLAFGGLRSIYVMRNETEPARVEIVEHWDSKEAHASYMRWRTETGALEQMKSVLVSPPAIEIWTLVAKG